MRGLILGAGIGKRLRPITNEIPKCLIEVGGKTLIEHALDGFDYAGISEVVIAVGFNEKAVKEKVGHNYRGIKITYRTNPVYDTTNNLRSLWYCRDMIDEPFIQAHGDVLFNKKILKKAVESGVESAVIVNNDKRYFIGDANRVRLEHGRVVQIDKFMPFEECAGAAFGLYKFSKAAAHTYRQEIEKNKDNAKEGFEIALRPTMVENKFGIIDVTGFDFAEIDDLNDLEDAKRRFSEIIL
jgi:choline kinase